jgi:hypothetical protein
MTSHAHYASEALRRGKLPGGAEGQVRAASAYFSRLIFTDPTCAYAFALVLQPAESCYLPILPAV